MKSICTNPCCSTRENVILQEIKLNNLILGDGGDLVVPRDAFYRERCMPFSANPRVRPA